MKLATGHLTLSVALGAASLATQFAMNGPTWAAPPTYTIYDLGVVSPADGASQGFRVSSSGIATGRSVGSPTRAFTWTELGGLVGLPNLALPARNFSVGNGVNDAGVAVGNGTTTTFGSSPLPLIWQAGTVAQLPLPAGQTLGRANDINNANVAVGSVNAGSLEIGSMYSSGTGTTITALTPSGCFLRTAFAINDAGLVCGFGIDPSNAARNVGFVYDSASNTASEVGALPGLNGALAFDVSNAGHIVGSSMLNQGSGLPFIWTSGGGIQPIPLPVGTSQASARGVNSSGWVVGTASSAFAIPFLFDGSSTYRLADLLPPASGWDLSTNTSSSALGISELGIIVGTGIHNGNTRGYAMVPQQTVPVALEEFVALGAEAGIELRWQFTATSDAVAVSVERAPSGDGPWQAIALAIDGSGRTSRALDTNVVAGEIWFYRLNVADRAGERAVLGMVSAQRAVESSLRVALGVPAPNPAPAGTSVSYRIAASQNVRLTVHDAGGHLVRTLLDRHVTAGEHVQQWDGRTDRGTNAPAGLYFIRMHTASVSKSQRVILLR